MTTMPNVVLALRRLMTTLGMDYGAANFKTDERTGELVFLEINSSPMFTRSDVEVGGRLAAAIVTTPID